MTSLVDRPWVAEIPTDLYIGGAWRAASRPDPIPVQNPATEGVLAAVADASPADGLAAVDAASAALPGWAATSPRKRSEVLYRAFELMTERRERLAELIVLENGKALTDARGEVAYAAEFFRWYAEEAVRAAGTVQTAPAGTNKIMVLRQPIGVAVLVTPWNFPAAMATRKIGPALAAGCTVVLKPATETPLTALAIVALLEEAGVPPGVVNCLTTRSAGAVVGAMVDDPRVRKLSFLVLADADLDAALAGAMVAKMRNGGSACTAANRFYVHSAVEKEFSSRLAEAMGALVVGSGLDAGVQVGPLVNESSRDKVEELVSGAVDGGAGVLTGGSAPGGRGWFYPPTVLHEVAPDAAILREEIFGPVAPIVSFDSVEDAIAMANDTEFGLISYVYAGDLAEGLRVAERLDAGMVGLNRGVVSDPAAPFGGTKQSGVGREGGHEGMLEYLESKYIAVDW
jgi:succinate-semialdehyde dehydrogenase/glutarate-semialdehyde dehydrogenase